MNIKYKKPYIIVFLFIPGCWFIGQGSYIHAKALLAQNLLEQAWSDVKQGKSQSKPWPWADTWPVARLKVPRLDIDLIVLAGDSGRTLAFGPGHNFASAIPGNNGNSLISAHRDTHFNFLQNLKKDDSIFIETAQQESKLFKVISTRIVDMDDARFIDDKSSAYIHLVTCYPFDSITPGGSQRYIVTAIAHTHNTNQSNINSI
ncbi:MAG: class GN sortase [Gammaproteobacteria bacterium]|nr:class GN sortase [Gammaproteobacteria bacterium]